MTDADIIFIEKILASGILSGRVLELGGGYGGDTCRPSIERKGLEYLSTDLATDMKSPVDFVANFESGEGLDSILASGPFGAVIVLNVLEHTFQPIAVLDNAARLLSPGGHLIVATPASWPVHNFPIDCQRLLPDWYRKYSEHSSLEMLDEFFDYLTYGTVDDHRIEDLDILPHGKRMSGIRGIYSRVIHKLFNTGGRGIYCAPHIMVGAVYRKPFTS